MQSIGVEVVRTGVVQEAAILAMADSLGLRILQELPVQWQPASGLLDTLQHVRRQLSDVVMHSAPFSSARDFGLAQLSDTSDPRACAYFAELMNIVRSIPGARGYYSTTFARDDRCSETVDYVLVEALGVHDPVGLVDLWVHATPIGLAGLGQMVEPGSSGLLHPHSSESQARYLESHLSVLLQSDLHSVFVHRWRDLGEENYGLIRGIDNHRPSYDVVAGIYSGRQKVFAFSQGSPPKQSFSWSVLLGWIAMIALASLNALSLRFRSTLRRYFFAHGYYVESVRSGREVLSGPTLVLFLIEILCAGFLLNFAINAIDGHESMVYVRLLAERLGGMLGTFFSSPLKLVGGILAAIGVIALLLVTVVSVFQRDPFTKIFMIIVWPFWGLIPMGLFAVSFQSTPDSGSPQIGMIFLLVWGVYLLLATGAALMDLSILASRKTLFSIVRLMVLTVMMVVIAVVVFRWWTPEIVTSLTFLWHLITRS